MTLSETVLVQGIPVGRILQHQSNRSVTFQLRDDLHKLLTARTFPSAVTCREAVIDAYTRKFKS